MAKTGYVYILASRKYGTLYIGLTNNPARRVNEHKTEINESFTKRYHIHRLVYYEVFDWIGAAIRREKQLKKWNRLWKIQLIESVNPEWRDLSEDLL